MLIYDGRYGSGYDVQRDPIFFHGVTTVLAQNSRVQTVLFCRIDAVNALCVAFNHNALSLID